MMIKMYCLLQSSIYRRTMRMYYCHRRFTGSSGAETGTIDCIVLDVLLKGESGFDLCRKIRSFSSVPIVFLTNLSSQEDLKNGFLMGADDYITKPFSLEELYLRIQARIRSIIKYPPDRRF